VNRIVHVLIGDLPTVGDVAIKNLGTIVDRCNPVALHRTRALAEFAPFDWIAAVAAGAIVGRAATALLCLLAAHAVLARLRLIPALCRVQKVRPSIQPPPGGVNRNQIGENR